MKTLARLAVMLSLAACLPMPAFAQTTPVADTPEAPEITITVSESANLRALADKQGYDGHSAANYLFIVPAKTNILGKQGGGPGIDTGKWPEGVSLVLLINGNVYGGGGNGGDGGDTPATRDGGRGGDAIYVQAPIAIAITKTGSVKAGGGGGAGADGVGSGGGGGFPNGMGGEGGGALQGDGSFIVAGNRGYYGTIAGGGKGGQRGNAGGDGGNTAQPGQSLNRMGGGEGFAIRTNDNAVILDNQGDLRGQIG